MKTTIGAAVAALLAAMPAYGVDFHIYTDPTGVVQISPKPPAAEALIPVAVAAAPPHLPRPPGRAPLPRPR